MSNYYYIFQKNASKFRDQFGYSQNEFIALKSLLLKLNVITIFKPLSDNFSGMALEAGNSKFMMINSNQNLGRQHFSIGHELYHLFIQDNFNSHTSKAGAFNKKDKIEFQADLFAVFLLLPEDGVISLIPESELRKDKIELSTILKIEQYYQVSRRFLLFRLMNLGLITDTVREKYLIHIMRNAQQYGYDTNLYDPKLKINEGVVIGDYGQIARLLYEKDKISESHYISLMNSIGKDVLSEDFENDEE